MKRFSKSLQLVRSGCRLKGIAVEIARFSKVTSACVKELVRCGWRLYGSALGIALELGIKDYSKFF